MLEGTHVYRLSLATIIAAPVQRCFDLARSIDLHVEGTRHTRERAVDGVTHGLIGPDEEVTWEATHLGVRQRLRSRITAYDRPTYFQDSMVEGAFRSFRHDHRFRPLEDGRTEMTDEIEFAAPLGPVGWIVDRLVLAGHLRRFLVRRNATLASVAESPDAWRRYLSSTPER